MHRALTAWRCVIASGIDPGVTAPGDATARASARAVLAVLTVAYVVSFIDRQALSLLVEPIRRDLGLTDMQLGMLQGLAFASVYAEDALFLSPSGTTRGRAELVERYRRRYPDAAAMGRLTLEVLEVRAGADTAGVAARWTLSYADRPEATGLTLLVFRKTAAGWQIVQDASF